jgi:DNA-binding transcriptional LysR family regulator
MDLTQIRYFLSLANTLNFTRASEQCNVTQPALTKSIQRLEAELGGPLLLRERNHTQLTPLGTTMLPLLQQTFDAADNARRAAARFRKQDVARLQIGLGPRVEPDVISPLLWQLSRRFPSLELTLRQSEGVLASEIDVPLSETAERLTDRATCWMVFEDPIVVLLPEGHTLAEEAAITPDQLRSCAMIGRVDHDGWDNCGEIDLDALGSLIRHRGSGEAHVHALVRGGQGVALSTASRRLPPCILRRPLTPRRHVTVSVATLAGRQLQRPADIFLRLARARLWEEAETEAPALDTRFKAPSGQDTAPSVLAETCEITSPASSRTSSCRPPSSCL